MKRRLNENVFNYALQNMLDYKRKGGNNRPYVRPQQSANDSMNSRPTRNTIGNIFLNQRKPKNKKVSFEEWFNQFCEKSSLSNIEKICLKRIWDNGEKSVDLKFMQLKQMLPQMPINVEMYLLNHLINHPNINLIDFARKIRPQLSRLSNNGQQVNLNLNENKKIKLRLTENDLNRIIIESVKRILKEIKHK